MQGFLACKGVWGVEKRCFPVEISPANDHQGMQAGKPATLFSLFYTRDAWRSGALDKSLILSIYACGAVAWLCGAVRRLPPPTALERQATALRSGATALESHTRALRSHTTARRSAAAAPWCGETAPQSHATALRDIWRRESEWWRIPRYGAAGLWGRGV